MILWLVSNHIMILMLAGSVFFFSSKFWNFQKNCERIYYEKNQIAALLRKKFEKSRPMIKYFSLLMDHLALYIYIILIFIIFFSSSNQYFMNSTEHPPTLFSTCNQHCDCVDSEYHPVCAEFHDGKQTAFFSPCYAGCDKKYEPLQKVSFIKFSSYIFVIF